MEPKYKYIGKGDALYHVPARDLTEQDIAERAETWKEFGITESLLVKSGLYEKAETKKPTKKGSLDAAKEGE